MLFLDGTYLVYPWTIKVSYVDPVFRVAEVQVYYELLDTTMPMWMCIDSIIEAGKAPLFGENGKIVQDMAFMSENQEHVINSCIFDPPVKDENGMLWYPELSFHIQYVLDVIFGIKEYETPDGVMQVATDLKLAEKWRKSIIDEGAVRMKKALKNERYLYFISGLEKLKADMKPFNKEEKIQQLKTVKTLTARL